MDIVSAQDIIRDCLRLYLIDPYETAGGNSRSGTHWIFTGEPDTRYKHPAIFIKLLDNPNKILNINQFDWTDQEFMIINIWFYTKAGFKITVGSEVYANNRLVDYYVGLIKTILKQNQTYLWDNGVKGFSKINTVNSRPSMNKQEYYGAATIRVFWFNIPS
jgi:hypothetical protein